MNSFQKFLLQWIVKSVVKQGNHKKHIQEYYRILHKAAIVEFTEDNAAGLQDFLKEQFERGGSLARSDILIREYLKRPVTIPKGKIAD